MIGDHCFFNLLCHLHHRGAFLVFKNSLISLFPYASSEEKHDVYSLWLLFLGACLSKCCMADASFLEQGDEGGVQL
jgi:hypothetical protein